MIAAYEAIAAKAEEVGWPLFYRRDLTVHDLRVCSTLRPSDAFLWILFEHGTHLIVADALLDSVLVESFLVRIDKLFGPCRYFWWDAGTVPEDLEQLSDLEQASFVLEGRMQELRHRQRMSAAAE